MSDDEVARQFGVSPRMIRRLRRNTPKHKPSLKEKPMITGQLERITPEIAAAMLANNADNRRIAQNTVAQFVSDMRAGNWKMTGQPIIIAEDGQLNDGQHRLTAVVQAGVAIEMMVIRGAPRDSRDAIDTGKSRQAGDILQMFHVANGNEIAGLARMVISWERAGQKRLGDTNVVSKSDVVSRGQQDEQLNVAVRSAYAVRHIMMKRHAAFARYVIPETPLATEFFARLADGADLNVGHPVLTVRHWMMRSGRRIPDAQAIEAILRAWCAFRDGRELSRIQLMGEFPKP
jgi:hypothetical protein